MDVWFCIEQEQSPRGKNRERSEEHTSELQSQSNLVCRLLLEKKKTCHDRVRFSVYPVTYNTLTLLVDPQLCRCLCRSPFTLHGYRPFAGVPSCSRVVDRFA